MRILTVFLITSVLFCSCSTNTKIEEPEEEPTQEEPEPIKEVIRPISLLTQEMYPLVNRGSDFAIRFFKQVSQERTDDNLFLSPYSLGCALGMLYNGAEGKTKEEIATVMAMSDYTPEQLNEYYQTLTKALIEADQLTELGVANAIWSHTPYPVKKSFADLMKKYYDAEISTMDFYLPSSIKAINDWAKEKTKGTIPEVVRGISPPIILANAVYFKSPWTVKFNKSNTVDMQFYNGNGVVSTVPIMHQKELRLKYAHTSDYEFVQLPYANETFAMNILLPKEGITLEQVIESLDGTTWETLRRTANGSSVDVTLSMPRFKLRDEMDLNNALIMMGMPRAFTGNAEFLAMLDVNTRIEGVSQFSYIDVNEEGTEAAAVTIIRSVILSDLLPPPPKVTMVVDRPFIFAITEQSTGAILFMGKVVNL